MVGSQNECRFINLFIAIFTAFAITSTVCAHAELHRSLFKQNRTLNVQVLMQSNFRTFFLIGMRIIVFLRHFFLQFHRVVHMCGCAVWPDFALRIYIQPARSRWSQCKRMIYSIALNVPLTIAAKRLHFNWALALAALLSDLLLSFSFDEKRKNWMKWFMHNEFDK